ncbi:hypothetical protein HOLleu_13859 [Holothuria leucospilota]|uniref:CCHC-type domain-containing protein n=1 Tax=Holothuria leucospilota TaxID=206669 RepID=A0A9Q1C897_HOLLE|nr:hypothetical protein HOLleu_13859 [Holothuria leucospilota]
MEYEKYVRLGKEIGLSGQDLLEFANNRETTDKKERAKLEKEAREEKDKQRQHEKDMKEYELKLLEERQRSGADGSNSQTVEVKLPKLPPFRDGRDEMDAYLFRFERFATLAGWPQSQWATSLGTLLTGQALEVYSRMPSSEANDFEKLKTALLNGYFLTREGYRQKLRSSKCGATETYAQFCDRIKGYLRRWAELSEVPKTYDGLFDLIIQEQMLWSSDKELAIFLKERSPKTASEMATLADGFKEAHVTYDGGKRKSGSSSKSNKANSIGNENQNSQEKGVKNFDSFVKEKRCYVCGKVGHLAKDCRKKFKTPGEKGAAVEISVESNASQTESNIESAALCLNVKPNWCGCHDLASDSVELSCGHKLPIVTAACAPDKCMPVCRGVINNLLVGVLRDSGCSTVVVKKDLVQSHQMVDRTQRCVLIDGTVRNVPVAQVTISSPYFEGTVEALCMDPSSIRHYYWEC